MHASDLATAPTAALADTRGGTLADERDGQDEPVATTPTQRGLQCATTTTTRSK
jgi:hypothetical protein